MEANIDVRRLAKDSLQRELFEKLQANLEEYGLQEAHLFFQFPVLKNADDEVVVAELVLASRRHGLVVFAFCPTIRFTETEPSLEAMDQELDQVYSLLCSRLLRNKSLRQGKMALAFDARSVIYAPRLDEPYPETRDNPIVISDRQLDALFPATVLAELPLAVFSELLTTLEGSHGLRRPRARPVPSLVPTLKGAIANKAESEMTSFDNQQQRIALRIPEGIERVRGLAGSGKTVVLAMKAALTHLRQPESMIAFTFYTKSLYQHIQRLIARFYKQFDDREPDWSRIRILHGWGGTTNEGIYYNACKANGVSPINLSQARAMGGDPFDVACRQLLDGAPIRPAYDYVFVDEGQDFPSSFMQLCLRLSVDRKVVFAYDDLQTIFQPSTPDIGAVIGKDQSGNQLAELSEDTILYKCYRNPREVLVCAHAVGFGIYGTIVQMLENRPQWEDIGYKVVVGDFLEASPTEIERPAENSLTTISGAQAPSDIVKAQVFASFEDELSWVESSIKEDIVGEGLRPDDILVAIADDRNARGYLQKLGERLQKIGIPVNNIHEGAFGIPDFQRDGQVTLSTVHKAKGNEAFMVYVLGVDALFRSYAGVRERNILFTAMTRAKGWVRVSGIGDAAKTCKDEIDAALSNFPMLRFKYPSQQQLRIIKRDLGERASRKQSAERKLEEVLEQLNPDEVRRFLSQRAIKKGV